MYQEGNSSFNLFQTLDRSIPSEAELLIAMSREIHNLQPMHCKDFNPQFFVSSADGEIIVSLSKPLILKWEDPKRGALVSINLNTGLARC